MLKIVQAVGLGFSNMEWMQLGISGIAWQWFEDTHMHVLIIAYVYLQQSITVNVLTPCNQTDTLFVP